MSRLFGRNRTQDDLQSKTAKDPICGMTVEKATALKSERDRQTYYFAVRTVSKPLHRNQPNKSNIKI